MGRRAPLDTDLEMELVRRYEAGEATRNLCAAFDRSDTGVRDILRRHGVAPSHSQQQLTAEQEQEARRLYESGLNVRDVSKRMGLSEQGAQRALNRIGTQMRPCVKRHLLTPGQGTQLAADYKAGGTFESLQKKYGVSDSVISRVLREHGVQPRIGWASYRNVKYTDRHGVDHSFKSTWEAAYAKWMDERLIDWKYEPCRFALKECRQYTPDFGVYIDGSISHFVEVKGWVTKAVECRMVEFRRVYPQVRVVLVGPADLARLGVVDEKYARHPQQERVRALRETLADA